MRRPGFGRYAFPERERRFLVDRLPAEVSDPVHIDDHYIDATTLRLRRVSGSFGDVNKLAQKVRPDHDDPATVMLTNIYLSDDEYRLLSTLPGRHLVKTRYRLAIEDRDVAVDEFDDALRGLVLIEADFESDEEMQRFTPPPVVVREVTGDDRFSGGNLSRLTEEEVPALLEEMRRAES